MANLTTYLEARKTLARLCCLAQTTAVTATDSSSVAEVVSLRQQSHDSQLGLSAAEFAEIMAEFRAEELPSAA